MNEVRLNEIKKLIDDKPVEESLLLLSEKFKDKIVFSTSLSLEDQVITDIIYSNDLPIRIFTIDTGRLFNETYSVLNKTNEFYDKKIQIYFPKNDSVESLVNEKGPFSFYGSVENRKECKPGLQASGQNIQSAGRVWIKLNGMKYTGFLSFILCLIGVHKKLKTI